MALTYSRYSLSSTTISQGIARPTSIELVARADTVARESQLTSSIRMRCLCYRTLSPSTRPTLRHSLPISRLGLREYKLTMTIKIHTMFFFLLETVFVFLILYSVTSTLSSMTAAVEKLRTVISRMDTGEHHRTEQPSPTEAEGDTVVLSNEAIQAIRDESNCTICTDPLGDTMSATTCGHIFHPSCLESWFDSQRRNGHSSTCPICRAHVRTLEQASAMREESSTLNPLGSSVRVRDLLSRVLQGDEIISVVAAMSN